MTTSTSNVPITGDELLQIAHTGRYELVKGELIRLSAASLRHGQIEGNAYFYVDAHVRASDLGETFVGEIGVYLERHPDTVRGADVAFYSHGRLPEGDLPPNYASIVPDFVVEVVVTEDDAKDLRRRVDEWLCGGVRLLWVAFAATRTVVVHRPGEESREFGADETLDGGDVLPGLQLPVIALFERPRKRRRQT